MIRFACPGCAATFTVDDNRAGKSGKCPKCQSEFVIPETEPVAVVSVPVTMPVPVPVSSLAARNAEEPVEIEPCPKCATKLSVSGGDIGNDVECPYCKTVFQAIEPGSRPPAPPPAPSRKSMLESTDDNGRPKSRRNDADDDDDRPRKRRRDVDDDEDDVPKIKSKSASRRRDEDDAPKSKSKSDSRRRDEDDDNDDAPRSRTKSSRRRDEDDDYDDDRPRKKRYRRGGGGGDSRRTTITRIGVLACGKVMAMVLTVWVFISFVFSMFLGLIVGTSISRTGGPDVFASLIGGSLITLVIAIPISLIGGFISGMILALIYNAAASIAGGFEMEIEED